MIHAQNEREDIVILDGAVTDGATATGFVDTLGYDYCTISVCASTSDDTTNIFTTLKIAEGQTTSAYTTVGVFDGEDTTDGFTINPLADTSVPQVIAKMGIDLTKRERYLKLSVSPQTTQAICALARLGYADETPTSITNLGVAVQVIG